MRRVQPSKSPQPTGTKPETTTPNEDAGSTDEKRSFNSGWITWPCVIFVLYVLSYGPALMLLERGRMNSEFLFVVFYRPVGWAYDRTPLHKPLGIYLHFWAPEFYTESGDRVILL